METCSLNNDFEEYDEVTFSVVGPHNIHLSGFFYGEKPDSDYDDYESDSDMERSLEAEEMNSEDDSDFAFDEAGDVTDNEMDIMPNSGELAVGNIVRRVLHIIREEDLSLTTTSIGGLSLQALSDDEDTVDRDDRPVLSAAAVAAAARSNLRPPSL
ncbi:hypothetical protein L2E82_52215 [Cichorium intybus]|nr:hypothetical protein L2E82_52215 [Cichorium intybus]